MKLITLDQLKKIYNDLLNRINTKISKGSAAEVSSLKVSDKVTMSYDERFDALSFVGPDGKGSVNLVFPQQGNIISFSENPEAYSVGMVELRAFDKQSLPISYAFPTSPEDVVTRADGPYGGGSILTSKYRFYSSHLETYDSGYSNPSGLAWSGQYCIFENYPSITVTLRGFSHKINEYWLEFIFPSNVEPAVAFTNRVSADSVVWPQGEPTWSTLGGKRIQIHILNWIATYYIIDA